LLKAAIPSKKGQTNGKIVDAKGKNARLGMGTTLLVPN